MPKGTKVSKERKRTAIAKALVQGHGPAAIARTVGCAESHVRRIEAEPETKALIREIMAPHRRKLAEMAAHAVEAVDAALQAKRTDEADHAARMRAVGRYGELLELAEGKKDAQEDTAGESGGRPTLVQLIQFIMRNEAQRDNDTKPR